MTIYKEDASKFIEIGEPGYTKEQEQAKTYFDVMPENDCFLIEVYEENLIEKISQMTDINIYKDAKEPILIRVDNRDEKHIGMIIFYMRAESEATHKIVSYGNRSAESVCDLANDILNLIKSEF